MMEGSDGDFRLVRVLIALLSSKDEDVAAIACYDIGEFVRHYPNGRAIAKRLGAKELVMPLIEHENVELQRHALHCVSKIMTGTLENDNDIFLDCKQLIKTGNGYSCQFLSQLIWGMNSAHPDANSRFLPYKVVPMLMNSKAYARV